MIILLASLFATSQPSDDASKEEVIIILRNVYEQFKSLELDYSVIDRQHGDSRTGQFHYVNGKSIRIICDRNDAYNHDQIIKNGVISRHNRFTKALEIRRFSQNDPQFMEGGTAEIFGLMGLMIAKESRYTGCTYLELVQNTNVKCNFYYDSSNDLVIEALRPNCNTKTTFSRKHNFMPKQYVMETVEAKKAVQYEMKIHSFTEHRGVYFPTKVTLSNSKRQPDEVFEFRNVKVNQPIPDSVFADHQCPPGTVVVDAINQLIDTIDASGKRVRTKMEFVDGYTFGKEQPGQAVVSQTKQEPQSLFPIVMPIASILVVLVAVFIYWYQRRRSRTLS